MTGYFLDTNIFLRVLVKEKEKTFNDCYNFLQMIEGNKINAFTSSLVLAEADWVLEGFYDFKKKRAVDALRSICRLKGLTIVDEVNTSLALEFYKNHKVKFVDALIASNHDIQEKKMAVVSYDEDFDKLGVIRKEPQEIVK